MNLDTLRQGLPAFAADIKLNLNNVLNAEDSPLSGDQRALVALASAYATRHLPLFSAIEQATREQGLSETAINAARTAATLMAMNNVYYRFLHLAHEPELDQLPARLRMQGMINHGIAAADFELMALAVSAINACGRCIESHVKAVQKHGLSLAAVQECARIAAVIAAAAQAQQLA